jgi:hypothetical protein
VHENQPTDDGIEGAVVDWFVNIAQDEAHVRASQAPRSRGRRCDRLGCAVDAYHLSSVSHDVRDDE